MAKGKHSVIASRMRSSIEEREKAQLKARIEELESSRRDFEAECKREANRAARVSVERIEATMNRNAAHYHDTCEAFRAQLLSHVTKMATIFAKVLQRCKERGDWEPVVTMDEILDLTALFGSVELAFDVLGWDKSHLDRRTRRASPSQIEKNARVNGARDSPAPDRFERKRKDMAKLGKLAKETPLVRKVNDALRAREDCSIHIDTGSNLYRMPHPKPALLTWPSALLEEDKAAKP